MINIFNPWKEAEIMYAHYRSEYQIHRNDLKRALTLKQGLRVWEQKRIALLN